MYPLHKFKCAILGKGRGNLSTDRLSLPRACSLSVKLVRGVFKFLLVSSKEYNFSL